MKKPSIFTFFGSQLSAQQHVLDTLPAALQERGWAAAGSLGQPPDHGKGGTVQQGRERTEAPQRQSHSHTPVWSCRRERWAAWRAETTFGS